MNFENENSSDLDLNIITQESDSDPLLNELGTSVENDSGMDDGMNSENDQNELGTHQEDGETPLEDSWDDSQNVLEDDEDEQEDASETEKEDSEINLKTNDDPLKGMGEKKHYTAQDYIEEKQPTQDYLNKLEKWGIKGLDVLDEMNANLCVAIGGGHPSHYTSSKAVKRTFYEATIELAKTMEFKPPTPMQAFLMALGAILLPSLGKATFRKFTTSMVDPNPLPQKVEPSETPQAQTDYTSTKEHQEGRTKFKVFASNGAYQYNKDGEYVEVKFADDFPSTEIQKLLDEGKTTSEIKSIVYG